MHEPLILENSVKDSIIVFIHGFMGSPRQFDRLAQFMYAQGYSVASLLLPGHGSTVKKFSSSTMEMWQGHVDAEIERFMPNYKSIYLVGHSMGCLLAINASIKNKERIHGLFLIACPFELTVFSIRSIKLRLIQIFCSKRNPIKAAYVAGSSVPPGVSMIWRVSRPMGELKKLVLTVKNCLTDIHIPVTAIFSSADELVSISSLDILMAGLNQTKFDYIVLSDSFHAYYPEHEQIQIENALGSAIFSAERNRKA